MQQALVSNPEKTINVIVSLIADKGLSSLEAAEILSVMTTTMHALPQMNITEEDIKVHVLVKGALQIIFALFYREF